MNYKKKVILAPLAGVTDIAFRKVCTYCGADIVYSQMIDSRAFVRGKEDYEIFDKEKNVVGQIIGNDVKSVSECAKKLGKIVPALDLNLGCPKVSTQEAGGWLMRKPKLIGDIVRAMVRKARVPVSVKIRAGMDKGHINAVKIARICENNGVTAIAVHGRAFGENYEMPVRYDVIKAVKDAVSVPVIGNGNIFSGEDAKRMYELTGCDSVMVGRAAIGNPLVFNEIKSALKLTKRIRLQKKGLFLEYLKYASRYKIELVRIKQQAQWFTKGEVGGAKVRHKINNLSAIKEIKQIFSE